MERLLQCLTPRLLKAPQTGCAASWLWQSLDASPSTFFVRKLGEYEKMKSMDTMHTYWKNSICIKVIVECTVRLGEHSRWWPTQISSRPSSAQYFHSWLEWWNRRWATETVRWPQIGRTCKKMIIWSRGVEFKVVFMNYYKMLKINKVKFNERKCNEQHTKSMTKL